MLFYTSLPFILWATNFDNIWILQCVFNNKAFLVVLPRQRSLLLSFQPRTHACAVNVLILICNMHTQYTSWPLTYDFVDWPFLPFFSSDDAAEAGMIIEPKTRSRPATVRSIMSNLLSCIHSGFILMLWIARIIQHSVTGWKLYGPVTVCWRPEAWCVFAHLNTRNLGSNSTWGKNVCPRFLCACVVMCVERL
jgi:hypothetical protein